MASLFVSCALISQPLENKMIVETIFFIGIKGLKGYYSFEFTSVQLYCTFYLSHKFYDANYGYFWPIYTLKYRIMGIVCNDIFSISSYSAIYELIIINILNDKLKVNVRFLKYSSSSLAMASTTLCAIFEVVFCASISSYSFSISVFTHKLILPANTSLHIL